MKSILTIAIAVFMVASCSNKPADSKEGETKAKPKKEIALQLYSLRDDISKDFDGIIKKVAEMGFTAVEAANYSDGKFYGKTPEEYKAAIEGAGMLPLSSHISRGLSDKELATKDFSEAMKWWDQAIAAHKAAGMKYIVLPWLGVPKTLKDLQTNCDYLNEIGKRCKENGISFGYHNHNHEFTEVEGQLMYDYMLEHTNPDYVFFQMDVYWTVRGQHSPVEYFEKYKGRFPMLHIKDHKELGQSGMVGFDAVFNHAEVAGLKYPIVEVEQYNFTPVESVQKSIDYLLDSPFVKDSYNK
jgi:sugar phosphate isomerase/epimerase